jgi:hypothetical protein
MPLVLTPEYIKSPLIIFGSKRRTIAIDDDILAYSVQLVSDPVSTLALRPPHVEERERK